MDGHIFHLDSGATSHCSPKCSDFVELDTIPTRQVGGINGTSIAAVRQGKIIATCRKVRKLTLKDILYVPQATLRLISVRRLADEGILSTFDPNDCTLCHGSKVMANGKHIGKGLYLI